MRSFEFARKTLVDAQAAAIERDDPDAAASCARAIALIDMHAQFTSIEEADDQAQRASASC